MLNCCLFSAFGFVPFLTSVLGTMMPMLESTKQDNMRWVFASGKPPVNNLILIIKNKWNLQKLDNTVHCDVVEP